MSAFNEFEKTIGFSTGALERGNYRSALTWLRENHVQSVELSALRFEELDPLVRDLDHLSLHDFSYISFHAPSSFPEEAEARVIELLDGVFKRGWNIIAHPDAIKKPELWQKFGSSLLLENLDRRKSDARTADELANWFVRLPEARLCLDLAHARQLDTTLTLLLDIVANFRERIAEIHISELDSYCFHQPMSSISVVDYRRIAMELCRNLPIIIESRLDGLRFGQRLKELEVAEMAMEPIWGIHCADTALQF